MCSLFEMENYQGDLTDIVRGRSTFGCKTEDPFSSEWQFSSEMAMNFSPSSELQEQAATAREEEYSFGDPFCAAAMRDPLLQELDICGNNNNNSSSSSSSSSAFFNGGTGGNLEDKSGGGGSVFGVSSSLHEDELIKRPCNIFSRMLQISPATITNNKFPISASACDSPLLIPNCNSPTHPLIHANNSDLHHFVDNNPSALQISSPRNNPAGIKRRKSQARKVVCVPAPVAASSRPNGEVIPSDLWAWRKYGQKPIKGSPYPRGYYRCSSSKGCSARKQVERSRTDPNMLVITYTSEHNHPWPTQRNALAGSSRSQQSKNNTPNPSKLSSTAQPQKPTTTTQEGSDKTKKDQINNNNGTRSSTASNNVKEEAVEEIEKPFETEEGDQFSEGFQYRVAMGGNNNQSDDFFADLEELETDPLNLLFTQGQKLDQISKGGGLDDVVAFNNLFDWAAENNNSNNNSNNSFEEPPPATASKRGFY